MASYKISTNTQTTQALYVLQRVRLTIVTVESNKCHMFQVCVCSLSSLACTTHAPYYIVICGLSGSTTFFHIIS
jgi:hypothetical protein